VVGAQIAPNDKLAIGFSHRSEIKHDLKGTLDFQNVPALLANDPRFKDGDGGARLVTPAITTLSISYGFTDNFRVLADYPGDRLELAARRDHQARYRHGRRQRAPSVRSACPVPLILPQRQEKAPLRRGFFGIAAGAVVLINRPGEARIVFSVAKRGR
jgi:hypothetical protein